jgi:hypothetical protein
MCDITTFYFINVLFIDILHAQTSRSTIMKTARYFIAGLALVAAGSSFAAEATTAASPDASNTRPHALTRAEVRAQVIEARRNGTLIETEADMYTAQTNYLMTGRPFAK